jgi:cytidine deaminase
LNVVSSPEPFGRSGPNGPELVFALVGATGSNLSLLGQLLTGALAAVGYDTEIIRVIELLEVFDAWSNLPKSPEEDRIERRMDAGDDFRSRLKDGAALARLSVGKIRDLREWKTTDATIPASRLAFILRSLKRKEEIAFLRKIYGPRLVVVGAFSPRLERVSALAKQIARSHYSASSDTYRTTAERLIQRDLDDQSKEFGQRVGDTFALADVFVDLTDSAQLKDQLERFISMLFVYPFHTPTRDEYGMFHAEAAARRSAALSRQVGAAITTAEGALIAVGTNDVPKAGGGLYWEGDEVDHRDHIERKDSSDEVRRNMVAEVLERLIAAGWIKEAHSQKGVAALTREAIDQRNPRVLRDAQMMRVIEYGRAGHADKAAIVDAASRGVPVKGATLYTTTYPCHNCARHIIAAGIERVVYVEPYPKSLTYELHRDAMVNDSTGQNLVSFQAFVGLAPRRYMEFFDMVERKGPTGEIVSWNGSTSLPRGTMDLTYINREIDDFSNFSNDLREFGIIGEQEANGE